MQSRIPPPLPPHPPPPPPPRTRLPRPVYVQPADPKNVHFEEVRTMTDFSRNGFYFVTNRSDAYRQGMQLYVIPAFGCFNFEYIGEVVRIDERSDFEYGVAVRLLRIGSPAVTPSRQRQPEFQAFSNIREDESQT
jgi:hypothetical protein